MSYIRYSIREVQTPPSEGSSVSIKMYELWGLLSENVFCPDAERACTREIYRESWLNLGAFNSLAEAEENLLKFIKEIASKVPLFNDYDKEGQLILNEPRY